MKVWKGYYHLNGARLPKPETEEDVEVLQSAETISNSQALILNVFQLQAEITFVKKLMMTKSIMLLYYKYKTLSNCYMIKKMLLVLEIIALYSTQKVPGF